MSGVNTQSKDLKRLLGNPKIIFVLGKFEKLKFKFFTGGPASGKGTQCEKIVEEFGFTHISTGDLMREEVKKGTPEGNKIKQITSEGGLVEFELTVKILVNALIAKPSKVSCKIF